MRQPVYSPWFVCDGYCVRGELRHLERKIGVVQWNVGGVEGVTIV